MTNISELSKKIDDQRKAYQDFVKRQQEEMLVAAKELFTGVFEAFPFVEAIVWAQYTPYFADGDPCEFSVHDMYPMSEGYLETEDFGYPEEDEFVIDTHCYYLEDRAKGKNLSSWAEESLAKWDKQVELYGEETIINLKTVLTTLSSIPDEIYESFGEGIVVASRDGIEVYEYDHD